MNAREDLLPSQVSAGCFAPRTQLRNVAVNIPFETNRVRIVGKFMALKPANGAQSE
jgi:hypothetical protein